MNNKLYIISEENHGTIGVADTIPNAIQLLIDTEWILGDEIFCAVDPFTGEEQDHTPQELFGEHWKEEIIKQNPLFFDGAFYFFPVPAKLSEK